MQRAVPPCAREEMLRQVYEVTDEGAHRRSGKLFGRGTVGPVDDQRFTNDIVTRHESPVPAVERVVTVVTHSEIAIRRNYDLAVLHVIVEHVALELSLQALRKSGRLPRKIVPARIVRELVVDVRLVQLDA